MESIADITIKGYRHKSIFEKLAKENMHLLIQVLLYILLAISSLSGMNMFNTLTTVLIILYFLLSAPHEHFYFLIGFVPFEQVLRFNNVSAYFILLLISVIKLIYKNKYKKYNISGILCLIYFISIEIFHEVGNISYGELLIVLSTILYFCFFVFLSDDKFYNTTRIVQNFCISFIIIMLHSLYTYGSVNALIQMISTSEEIVRFGNEDTSIGGAMGIPLYSAIVISLLISYYIIKPNLNLLVKLIIVFFCGISVLFGILTISRSFLLMMAVWLVFVVFSIFNKQRKRVFIVLILLVLIGIYVYNTNSDSINSIIGNYLYRANKDSGFGIRGKIWGSCFKYMNENSLGYIFGYGINNYVLIGYRKVLLFSALAHNLYIDIIMSIGITGFICLIVQVNQLIKKVKMLFNTKITIMAFAPLFVFLAFGFTALSLSNIKTWIYVLMLVIYAYAVQNDSHNNRIIDSGVKTND